MLSPSETKFSMNELEQYGCDPNSLIVPASQMSKKYEMILVETNREQMEEIRHEYTSKSMEEQKKYFKESFDRLNEVSLETLIDTKRIGEIWDTWKKQLLIFYICRYLLLKKELPILVIPPEIKK